VIKWNFGGFTLIIKRHKRVWTEEALQHEKWLKETNEQIVDRRSKGLTFL